jgi:hypothetical protein
MSMLINLRAFVFSLIVLTAAVDGRFTNPPSLGLSSAGSLRRFSELLFIRCSPV